jgi:hypothetical protein
MALLLESSESAAALSASILFAVFFARLIEGPSTRASRRIGLLSAPAIPA